jgi:hypothetical protein
MAALEVRAIDQETADARRAHFSEGDLLVGRCHGAHDPADLAGREAARDGGSIAAPPPRIDRFHAKVKILDSPFYVGRRKLRSVKGKERANVTSAAFGAHQDLSGAIGRGSCPL